MNAYSRILVGGILLALLAALPAAGSDYLLTIATAALYLAYLGQSWNILSGFVGQLALGHALFVGIGAYLAAALFMHYGINPWLGMLVAMAAGAACGTVIGALAFRFRVSGVHFAILTIAFAEIARTIFDHWSWVGGSGGLFLPVGGGGKLDVLHLRGGPVLFYYTMLALTALLALLCWRLMRSRCGYYWQAIRESPEAAEALGIDVFRYKMLAMVLSASTASVAGVVFAFQYNNLFPGQVFEVSRSVEIILGPIIGGLGTLAGPLLGALVLTGLSELLRELMRLLGIDIPGVKHVFYGVCLLVVIVKVPHGLWPAITRAATRRRATRQPVTTQEGLR